MTNRELLIQEMDPMLIKIQEIKDIEEIRFSDLMPSTLGDKITVLPSLLVVYNGGKMLNLCSKDSYFDVLVRKVFQVYNREKDRVVSDPTYDPFGLKKSLVIDERTKAILEAGDLTKVNEIYSFYDTKKSYDRSLLFQSDTLRMLLPIIKYHLKQIFDWTNRVITFEETTINGFRNNYGLDYKIDGIDDMLLINFVGSDRNVTYLRIRSREGNFKPVEMSISFNNNDITVNTSLSEYGVFASNCYETKKDNTVLNTFRVNKNDQPIIYESTLLETCENPLPNISGIDSDEDMIWYQLPWNAMFGVKNEVQTLGDVDEIVMGHNKYLAIVGKEFMMKEYASKEYRRKKTMEANANRVVMDQVDKTIYGILVSEKDGIYVIETYFDGILRNNGYYDTYLENKYFYHIAQSKEGLKGLKREGLVTISKDDEIIKSADLLVTDDLKKILRR